MLHVRLVATDVHRLAMRGPPFLGDVYVPLALRRWRMADASCMCDVAQSMAHDSAMNPAEQWHALFRVFLLRFG